MGVLDFEENRLRQQEIEVKALIALMRFGRTHSRKVEAEGKLCRIAFPENQIEEIEQETLDSMGRNQSSLDYMMEESLDDL